ncbi:MAG: efflux RND transporter periplasmic adaptor subunit [Planctomycetota bacterium]
MTAEMLPTIARSQPDSRTMLRMLTATLVGTAVLLANTNAHGQSGSASPVQSFTQPIQQVNVAAGDLGIIREVYVKPGDRVVAGQRIAQLDDRVLRRSLKIAEAARDARADRRYAEIDANMRRRQLEIYQTLHGEGGVDARELERVEAASLQADATLAKIDEQLQLRRLEYERIATQLDQRSVIAPIDGIVSEVRKQPGEFVSPNDPVVAQLVDVNRLSVGFPVPWAAAKTLKPGQQVRVQFDSPREMVIATVQYVLPVIEAGSNALLVHVVIDNQQGKRCGGQSCLWKGPVQTAASTARLSTNPTQNSSSMQRR